MTCGIYKITNKITNQCYIGKSIHIEQRWKEHCGGKGNKSLYQDIKKYGITNFNFEILEVCCEKDLNHREVYWIQFYDSYNQGYNLNSGGDNVEQATSKTQREIHCYDLNGTFITSYKSLAEAERITKVPNSNISKAARNTDRARAGKYLWSYQKLACLPPYKRTCAFKEKPTHAEKSVQQFTLQGEYIATYKSIKEAAESTHTNYSSLGMVCNGKRKTAGGYIWKFKA